MQKTNISILGMKCTKNLSEALEPYNIKELVLDYQDQDSLLINQATGNPRKLSIKDIMRIIRIKFIRERWQEGERLKKKW